jgi:type I restriction enzyme S subunit
VIVTWKRKRLAEVCTLQRGFDLPTKDRKPGDNPLVNSSGVADFIDQSKVRGPGVVTGRSGSIGNVFFVENDFWPLNTALYVKDFFGNDERFVFLLLQSLDLGRFASGTGVPTLNRNHVSDEIVGVPDSIEEQRRIVAVLDEAFAAIATATANAKKNLVNARDLFGRAIENALTGGDEGWADASFESCLEPIKYPAKIQRNAFLAQGTYPIVSQEASFINGFWDRADDLLRVPRPLVVFGDHTQVLKYIDFDFVLGADGVKLLLPKEAISGKFLYYFLKANPMPSTGYARHYRHLKSLTVRYPSRAQQQVMTDGLDELGVGAEELADTYRSKIEKLSALKQSLLHRAFTGELTATMPENIAA